MKNIMFSIKVDFGWIFIYIFIFFLIFFWYTLAGLLERGPRAGWARAPMGVHMGPHGGPWGHIYVFFNIISFISCINNIDILLLLICFVAKGFCWTPLASLHAASAVHPLLCCKQHLLDTPCFVACGFSWNTPYTWSFY